MEMVGVSWNRRCATAQVASSASLVQPNTTIRTLLTPAPLRAPSRAHLPAADWISSQLTRRFGLAGGLAWVGFLTFGVLSEQASDLGWGGVGWGGRRAWQADRKGVAIC